MKRMDGCEYIVRVIAAGAVACAVGLVGGCSRDTEATETVATIAELPGGIRAQVESDSTLKLGFAVYSRNCVGCHGINGDGQGPAAARLMIQPRDFTAGIFKFRSTPNGQLPLDSDLDRTLRQGLKGSSMPEFSLLPDREREAVIEFIKLYSDRWTKADETITPVPLPARAPEDLLTEERVWRGRFAYVAMSCHSCHGMTGYGDGPSSFTLKDDWGLPVRAYNYHEGAPKGGSDPLDIYRTFRTGVTPMPMYEASTLSLVTRDRKEQAFFNLHEAEEALIEPWVDALPTDAEVQGWKESAPERYERYSDERAWDLVAYTLWLREKGKPTEEYAAAIWPREKSTLVPMKGQEEAADP